jgi:signal transduction histidine kinase
MGPAASKPADLYPPKALRLTNLATYVVIGGLAALKYRSHFLGADRSCTWVAWVWLVAFTLGLIGLALGQSPRLGGRTRLQRLLRLGFVAAVVLFLSRWWPTLFGSLSLFFVAWEVAQLLTRARALVWVGVQTFAHGMLMVQFSWNRSQNPIALDLWWSNAIVAGGLQASAVLMADLLQRERQARLEQASAVRELMAARSQLIVRSRESERLHLARELHDALGHHLTALSLNLEVARERMRDGGPPARDAVDRAQALAHGMLGEVRNVVSSLRDGEGVDLSTTLQLLTHAIPSPEVHLSVPRELGPRDAARDKVLLRCIQECVSNAIRHAQARHVWIDVEQRAAEIVTTVRDDGRGAADFQEGNGLKGMRERLQAVAGHLDVAPGPPGFEAVIRIPRPGAGAAL